ncbi:hypothetical protein [Portibacter lacus]|uniref:hypothetical protein n=1 Tax=Portibacter lacus TaxID=1099794 RepID=UPI001F2E79D7|nr:hypothetical protein [Portibacter lacus]
MKILTTVTTVIFLVHFAIRFLERNSGNFQGNDEINSTMIKFAIILFLGGFYYASIAFREFSNLSTRAEFLALPGSSLEKITIKWLYTNPIFILTTSLLVFILASLLMPAMDRFVGQEYVNEIFTSRIYWNLVGIYFILHSIFFFGSIAFNKTSWIKTVLAVMIIALVIAALNAVWFRIVWADMFDGLFHVAEVNKRTEFGVNHEDPADMWQIKFFIFAFKYLLAPVLWVASLFKLSEKEV